jgi:hypothetical protein
MKAPAMPEHPGEIRYVDGASKIEIAKKRATELSREHCFVKTDAGWVPVVQVVVFTEGDRSELFEYGPRGELLRMALLRTDR